MSVSRNLKREREDGGEIEEKKKCLENSKNWCHLPPELKKMCIERMDLRPRLKLRATAKSERRLVDSTKMTFSVDLYPIVDAEDDDTSDFGFYCNLECEGGLLCMGADTNLLDIAKTMTLLGYIFQYHSVDHLNISRFQECYWHALLYQIVQNAPIRVQYLQVDCRLKIVKKLLRHCDPKGIVKVNLQFVAEDFDSDEEMELAEIPAVWSAECVHLRFETDLELPFSLVQKWIDRDAPIGTRLYLSRSPDYIGMEFVTFMEDAFISDIDEIVRFSTNNPEKHVILHKDFLGSHSLFIVVSPNMKIEDDYKIYLKYDEEYRYRCRRQMV